MTLSPVAAEGRVLVLAPTGRDAALTQNVLSQAGVACLCCRDLDEICSELVDGAGALLVAEEAIALPNATRLATWLTAQPPWSDLPVLVLARQGADSSPVAEAMELLGNVTVLERPLRVAALVSTIRAALRARLRQYQSREHLAQRERSERELRDFFDNAAVGLHWLAPDGMVLRVNDTELRMFGYTRDEYVGHNVVEFHEDHGLVRHVLRRLAGGESVVNYESRVRCRDGSLKDVLVDSSVLWDEGRFVHTRCFTRDVTDRKRAEQALREADRRKDEFLAILAHELRNPLAPISNSLHALRMVAHEDPTAERIAAMLERQVNHMVRLVDDLMEVSRITRGKIELRRSNVDVASVVRNAIETSRPFIDAGRHRLSVNLPDEPLIVDADPVRLAQVLANLLNNSARYTDPGGDIVVTVTREVHEVAVSVRDTGAGIPPEMLPRVFELFTQVDRTRRATQGGLGIGLTLVKTLVEMHGGTVRAHSDGPGQGSEFEVRLPLPAKMREPPPAPAAKVPQGQPLPARRVLVVDDNRDAAESLALLLHLLGAEVDIAYDGPSALRAIDAQRPAFVLLDIGMPGMDGHEVARRIRAREDLDGVRVIALTGWGQEEDRRLSRAAGFDHHLVKPADIASLQSLFTTLDRSPPPSRLH